MIDGVNFADHMHHLLSCYFQAESTEQADGDAFPPLPESWNDHGVKIEFFPREVDPDGILSTHAYPVRITNSTGQHLGIDYYGLTLWHTLPDCKWTDLPHRLMVKVFRKLLGQRYGQDENTTARPYKSTALSLADLQAAYYLAEAQKIRTMRYDYEAAHNSKHFNRLRLIQAAIVQSVIFQHLPEALEKFKAENPDDYRLQLFDSRHEQYTKAHDKNVDGWFEVQLAQWFVKETLKGFFNSPHEVDRVFIRPYSERIRQELIRLDDEQTEAEQAAE